MVFSFTNLNPEEKIKIKNKNYDEIEETLFNLQKLDINNVEFSKVNNAKVVLISEFIAKGILTREFLIENKNIIYNENELCDLVVENINLLSSNGINIANYSNSLNILLCEYLATNLKIINEYGLTIARSTSNINFLSGKNLENKLDFLISVGYDLTDSLEIINYNIEELIKFKIGRTLNISNSEIKGYSKEDLQFDFGNELIPIEIRNQLNSEPKGSYVLPDYLAQYQISNNIVQINGVLVSIPKIKRNLRKLEKIDEESIFYACIHLGNYSYEEVLNLHEALFSNHDLYKLVRRVNF